MRIPLSELNPIDRFKSLPIHISSLSEKELKKFCPLSQLYIDNKYDYSSNNHVEHFSNIITALSSFDEVFSFIFSNNNHVYLLGDESVSKLLVPFNEKNEYANNIDISIILETLSTLGLIYRFNVAVKFGYSNNGLMQIRLNGWGRQLFKHLILSESKLYKNLYSYWFDKVMSEKQRYNELLIHCSTSARPLLFKDIHNINNILPIPVVT